MERGTTLALMQTEYTYPVIGDRDTPDNWVDAGARDARDVAHEYVTTLAEHHPDHIDASVDAEIRDQFPSGSIEAIEAQPRFSAT